MVTDSAVNEYLKQMVILIHGALQQTFDPGRRVSARPHVVAARKRADFSGEFAGHPGFEPPPRAVHETITPAISYVLRRSIAETWNKPREISTKSVARCDYRSIASFVDPRRRA